MIYVFHLKILERQDQNKMKCDWLFKEGNNKGGVPLNTKKVNKWRILTKLKDILRMATWETEINKILRIKENNKRNIMNITTINLS